MLILFQASLPTILIVIPWMILVIMQMQIFTQTYTDCKYFYMLITQLCLSYVLHSAFVLVYNQFAFNVQLGCDVDHDRTISSGYIKKVARLLPIQDNPGCRDNEFKPNHLTRLLKFMYN